MIVVLLCISQGVFLWLYYLLEKRAWWWIFLNSKKEVEDHIQTNTIYL